MNNLITLNAIIIVIGLIPMMPFVSASLSDDIGVQLSKTCVAMIKNNLTTNCPTYEEILLFFPDSSDQDISGQFVFDGYFHREAANVHNEFRFYEYDTEKRYFIDPSSDIAQRVKLIVIEPRLDQYKIPNQVLTGPEIDVGHQRWVNDSCYEARISATDWMFLLGDTIKYLDSDCTTTNFDSIKKKTWKAVIHDITTSYKYFLDNWFKAAIDKCGQRVCFYQ